MDRLQIAVLFLIIIAASLPVMSIIKMQMINRFRKNAVVTNAIITQIEKRHGMKGAVYYMLSIEYKDNNGQLYHGKAVARRKKIAGSTIPIMFNKLDAGEYRTNFGKYLPWLLAFSIVFLAGITLFCYWLWQ